MIKDIPQRLVEGVHLAVIRTVNDAEENEWSVYLLNHNNFPLETVLIASTGYGTKDGEDQRTSTLRHMFEEISAGGHVLIEPIQPDVFHLTNEYFVTYYKDREIYEKRFVFVPDTITEDNLSYIESLQQEGVIHP
ncbi:MAG TPA: hypothetical protein DCE41_05630 [Cytophagales bacterium]|nr:hypothetical protein [Cytophagales bacterium]HAA21693.1 hypothetical protein [Cytophagales bacterium]HAP63236.1 hypothetical protein [Cytophagales bacterium]